jgi:hypothetical protein
MCSFSFDGFAPLTKWVITKTGSLSVKGTTNVNTFSCFIPNYSHNDTIAVYQHKSSIKLKGEMKLNVNTFDCHNAMMTAQLRKTLKGAQFPNIYIRFISLRQFPALKSNTEIVKGIVEIELANVTKSYEINYQFSSDQQDIIHLTGKHQVNFSHFNITPPTKLGGMIKTNDQLEIEFRLHLKAM